VVSVRKKPLCWLVRYADGDEEEVNLQELRKILVAEPSEPEEVDPIDLPEGWCLEEKQARDTKRSPDIAFDRFYVAPNGRRFRTQQEMRRYVEKEAGKEDDRLLTPCLVAEGPLAKNCAKRVLMEVDETKRLESSAKKQRPGGRPPKDKVWDSNQGCYVGLLEWRDQAPLQHPTQPTQKEIQHPAAAAAVALVVSLPVNPEQKSSSETAEGSYLGHTVKKLFEGHGCFDGVVVSVRKKPLCWLVRYADGDEEEVNLQELRKILAPEGESVELPEGGIMEEEEEEETQINNNRHNAPPKRAKKNNAPMQRGGTGAPRAKYGEVTSGGVGGRMGQLLTRSCAASHDAIGRSDASRLGRWMTRR
jgi:hypothetical protein